MLHACDKKSCLIRSVKCLCVQVVDLGCDPTDFDISGPFTIMASIRVSGDSDNKGRILARRKGNRGWEFVAPRYNGRVSFFASGIHQDIGQSRVNDGEWHNVAVSFDGRFITAFVDGNCDGAKQWEKVGSSGLPHEPLWLGARQGNGDPFDGDFKDVQFFDVALSEEQIQEVLSDRFEATQGPGYTLQGPYRPYQFVDDAPPQPPPQPAPPPAPSRTTAPTRKKEKKEKKNQGYKFGDFTKGAISKVKFW